MSRKKPILTLCLLLVFLISTPSTVMQARAQDQQANIIKFGLFPYKSPRTLIKLFAPIAGRIEEKTGMKVKLVSAPDYKSFIERGMQGEYDLLLPCVTCFFEIQPAGYHVIARGEPSFHGGVIVRADSGIHSMEQLKGKKIAAIGQHSYAGYMFVKDQLSEKNISPEKDVNFHFLKKNDSIIIGVMNKKYDAGVLRVDALKTPEFASVRDKLKILSRSPEIPQFPFVVKNDMNPATEAKIREVLLSINPEDEMDKAILQDLRIQKIFAAQDSDYEEFRDRISKHIHLGNE